MKNVIARIKRDAVNRVIRWSEQKQDRIINCPIDATLGRVQLSRMVPEDAIGAELGVASGYFSDALLKNAPFKRLYSIDAWADHHDDDEYLRCVRRLRKHGNRSVVMRMFFKEALQHFPDKTFDFIYIDAYAHTGQQDGQILRDWWPKLRPGGLFSGHDYDEAWPRTIECVDDFAGQEGLDISVLPGVPGGSRENEYASWFAFKR